MDNIKKYPKSKNNFQCLAPCYYPGTMVIHPTQLEFVTEGPLPFCPVDEWKYVDAKSGETRSKSTDTCYNPTEKDTTSTSQLDLNILTPYIDFNSEQFLKIYYKIFSFDDAIDWIDNNKHVPIGTKIRIINCALKAFKSSIELFDMRFCDFFIDFIKSQHMKSLYLKICNNVGIDEKTNEIFLIDKQNNTLGVHDKSIERTNYIIKTFINKEEITKFLQKYFKQQKKENEPTNEKNLEGEDDCLYKMFTDLTIYILNKINSTLQK
jgi:hypothetical protein